MRRLLRRGGTETVEFIVSFWAFMVMFFLTILVIVVFINALAAQRALNEFAVIIATTGGYTPEVSLACRESLKPLIQGTSGARCTGVGVTSNATVENRVCSAQSAVIASVTYSQRFLPGTIGTLFGIPSETELTRSMIILSQSTRGSAQC